MSGLEVVGLAVGVTGLFNSAVDCFENVQLGRSFGTNFETSLLRLDNARLRLSRWGQSVGLSNDIANTDSLHSTALLAEDIPKAERSLGQILELFAEAERVSLKFKSRASTNDPGLLVLDAQTSMDPIGRSLHEKMRCMAIKRQNKTRLVQKVKWALYEEKHFKRLIEDVTDLVTDLVDMFPAARENQRKLCELEVSEMGTNENFPILQGIAESQDKDLANAISNALKSKEGGSNSWNNYNSKVAEQVVTKHVHGNQYTTF